MFESLETGAGLNLVMWLQAHGSPLLDWLARALAILGGFPIYLLLFMPMYWAVDKTLAKRFLFALIIAGVAIATLKLAFERPRPFVAFPDQVTVLIPERTYGFPSGHVGITLPALGVLLASFVDLSRERRRGLWWLLAVYVGLIAWSRMYSGVHYPQDIIGGLSIGLATLVLILRYYERLARWWGGYSARVRVLLLLLASTVISFFLWRDVFDVVIAGALVGSGLGFLWDERRLHFSTAGSARQRSARILLGMVLVGVVVGFLLTVGALFERPVVVQIVSYGVVGFMITGVFPWLCLRVGLAGRVEA